MHTPNNSRAPVGVATCSALAPEVRQCCWELGIPAHLYSNLPVCLSEPARDKLGELVDRAADCHDHLLLVLGQCCGDIRELGAAHRAATLSAARCTDLLTGSGTHAWCEEHGVLLLPATIETLLHRAQRDGALKAALKSRVTGSQVSRLAAVHEAARGPSPEAVRQLEALAGCGATALYTGLGHLRQAIRRSAEDAGLPAFAYEPSPIDPQTLGPGDHCLVLTNGKLPSVESAGRVLARSMRRGIKGVWLTRDDSTEELRGALPWQQAGLQEWQASGGPEVLSGESVLADTSAQTAPQRLVDHWVARSVQALAQGAGGVCIVHRCQWADGTGLSTEYLLEYSSRLSAACLRWPMMVAWEVCPDSFSPHTMDELFRTHPLTWTDGAVKATRAFTSAEDYLGGEILLESLGEATTEPACHDLAVLVSALADGELDADACSPVSKHVDACPTCRELVKRSQDMKRMLGVLREHEVPVPPELWRRVRAALNSQA